MDKPLISIIVPVYNVELYVEDCIRSVMRQTYDGKMECIIVDDCGTDDSMTIVERLVSEYTGPIEFKILHHTHNRGLSAARNTGMAAATGDNLFFLDSDDWMSDDCIEKLVSPIISDPAIEIVQGNTNRVSDKKCNNFPIKILIEHARSNSEVRSSFFQKAQFIVYVWNKLISRSFIVKNNLKFEEGLLWEDTIWHFMLLKYVTNVYFVSNITYYYRERSNSIMTGTDREIVNSHFVVLFRTILSNLTPGYEKDEMEYYIRKLPVYFSMDPRAYRDVYSLFWERARQYHSYFCYKVLILTYFLRFKLGRMMYYVLIRILIRIEHPSHILNDINRIKGYLNK